MGQRSVNVYWAEKVSYRPAWTPRVILAIASRDSLYFLPIKRIL